ncbi:EpsG family protein [Methyloprofundus sp.]|uniref:EpsG family protein n=1 Tax=Methyloprofundus sp. TaxID=2020875 RepID=UPI003D0D0B53
MPWIILGFFMIILIGFREQVGGDWASYIRRFDSISSVTLQKALGIGDPGYAYINWLMASWGWGIYGVNLVCAIIFTSGLIVFCRQQIYPWLAFAVAVPYLIIVVGMGYTRQAVAVGLFFFALAYLERGQFKHYLVFILIATLFHKTAVLMIPFGIFLYGKGIMLRVVGVILVFVGAWYGLLAEEQENLWHNYVEVQMESQGAKIRVFMNLVPSLFLLLYWKRWKQSFPNPMLWLWMALASIVCFFMVGFASTAVDRMALYLIPIQVAVFSRLPYLAKKSFSVGAMTTGIVLGYTLVLFVWLNYASHAHYWVPYHNVIFQ